MEAKLTIAALCAVCVAAGGNWPANLKATLGDSIGDYVDVKLTWDAGTGCSVPYVHDIFIGAPHQPSRHIGVTRGTNFTIHKVEYWTNYTIRLQAKCLTSSRNITTFINTGPGNPHKVSNVTVRPSTFNATMDISEALTMPKIVDAYNTTVCIAKTGGPCFWQIIARNAVPQNLGGTKVTTQLKGLLPFTKYNVTVNPKIYFKASEFIGQPFQVSFTTNK